MENKGTCCTDKGQWVLTAFTAENEYKDKEWSDCNYQMMPIYTVKLEKNYNNLNSSNK